MSDPDRFDSEVAAGWAALSPPDGLEARVRERLAAAGVAPGAAAGTATAGAAKARGVLRAGGATASPAGAVARASAALAVRWRALLSSGALGGGVACLLLGLGFASGYWSRTDAARPSEPAPAISGAPHASAPGLAGVEAAASDGDAAASAAPARNEMGNAPGASTIEAVGTESGAPTAAAAAPPSRAPLERASSPLPLRLPRVRGAASAQRAARADASPSLEELQLLERAERALRSHEPALASALVAELSQRFPQTVLREERRAIELMAQCQAAASESGSERESRRLAARRQAFERAFPDSVYAERVARECASPMTNSEVTDMNLIKGGHDGSYP